MSETVNPSAVQFQLPKDIGHALDAAKRVTLTGVAGATTQLTLDQLVVADMVPPASSVQIWKLPPLHLWPNRLAVFNQATAAPGGESKVVLSEDGTTDVIGDNLSAANDYAILLNVAGERVIMIKEVTT